MTSEGALGLLARATNGFALELFTALAGAPGNLVFSPLSVHVALAMVLAGSRGDTAAQIARAMRSSELERHHEAQRMRLDRLGGASSPVEMTVANGMFVERELALLPAFRDALARDYHAECEAVDFRSAPQECARHINAWVSAATKGRVPEVLSERAATGLLVVVINAVYFKAAWATKFLADLTCPLPFTLATGKHVVADTMTGTVEARVAESDDGSMLELGYVGGRYVMDVVLPHAASGLPALERALAGGALDRWLEQLQHRRVVVELPRFTIDPPTPLELRPALHAMGIESAFDGATADFGGICAERAMLGDVVHKTYLAVTEEGTEAAAVTGMFMPQASPPRDSVRFSARHPFLFLVRDRVDGTIVVMGRLTDPRGG